MRPVTLICEALTTYPLPFALSHLPSQGADDSILNADGLTCYEGLSAEELNKM